MKRRGVAGICLAAVLCASIPGSIADAEDAEFGISFLADFYAVTLEESDAFLEALEQETAEMSAQLLAAESENAGEEGSTEKTDGGSQIFTWDSQVLKDLKDTERFAVVSDEAMEEMIQNRRVAQAFECAHALGADLSVLSVDLEETYRDEDTAQYMFTIELGTAEPEAAAGAAQETEADTDGEEQTEADAEEQAAETGEVLAGQTEAGEAAEASDEDDQAEHPAEDADIPEGEKLAEEESIQPLSAETREQEALAGETAEKTESEGIEASGELTVEYTEAGEWQVSHFLGYIEANGQKF